MREFLAMRLTIFALAALLAGPALAAESKNIDITVTHAAPGPVVPAGAQTVGFTTLALNSDFIQAMPKNWLGGCPNGADGSAVNTNDNTGHVWYQNIWWQSQKQPCSV